MSIIMVIQSMYPDFSAKERAIADYLIKESHSIKNMNISILSEIIGVSNASVTRFCKKVGVSSFADLKIVLSSENHEDVKQNSITQVHDYYLKIIDRTNDIIQKRVLEGLRDMVKVASRIFIYGVSSSGLTATELMIRLLRMGFNVQSITDSHLMTMNSSILTENDLVIAISVSGETDDINKALRLAKRNKSKTTLFTCFPKSTAADMCDCTVTVFNAMFLDKERFINSQFTIMYAIDLLSMLLLEDSSRKASLQTTVDTILSK